MHTRTSGDETGTAPSELAAGHVVHTVSHEPHTALLSCVVQYVVYSGM